MPWKTAAATATMAAGLLAVPAEKQAVNERHPTKIERLDAFGSLGKILTKHVKDLSPEAKILFIKDAERRYGELLRAKKETIATGQSSTVIKEVLSPQPRLPVEALEGTALDPQKLLEKYAYVALWLPNKDGSKKLHLIPPGKKWDGYRKATMRHFGEYSNAFFIEPTKLLVARHAFLRLEDPNSRQRPTPTDMAIVSVPLDQAAPPERIVPTDFSLTQEEIAGSACVTVGYDPDTFARSDGAKFEAGFCAPIGAAFARESRNDPQMARSLIFPIAQHAAMPQRDVIHQTPRTWTRAHGGKKIPHVNFVQQKVTPFAGMSSSMVLGLGRDGKAVLKGVAWATRLQHDGNDYRDMAFMHPVSEVAEMRLDPQNHLSIEIKDSKSLDILFRKSVQTDVITSTPLFEEVKENVTPARESAQPRRETRPSR